MAQITLQGYRCEGCLHEWVPRRSSTTGPRTCPKCRSLYWDTPRRVDKELTVSHADSHEDKRLSGDTIG